VFSGQGCGVSPERLCNHQAGTVSFHLRANVDCDPSRPLLGGQSSQIGDIAGPPDPPNKLPAPPPRGSQTSATRE
jgi:hypothetical protein